MHIAEFVVLHEIAARFKEICVSATASDPVILLYDACNTPQRYTLAHGQEHGLHGIDFGLLVSRTLLPHLPTL